MRKLHAFNLCSKSLLLFFAVMLSFAKLYAQTDYTIGTGTTGNSSSGYPCPLQDYDEGTRAQYLYKASELTAKGMAAGNITAIKFNITALNGATTIEQYQIKILATSVNSLGSATWEAGATTVYGPVDYTPVTGVNTFTLSSPFYWDGTSNIIVEVCNGDPNNGSGTYYSKNPTILYTTSIGFNGSHTRAADNLGNLCGTTTTTNTGTQTTRPNITFTRVAVASCSGTPAGGAAQSSVSSVCNNTIPFTVSVSGATSGAGITYQWEKSTDNSTWTPIVGATSANYSSAGITTSTYYRRQTSCGAFSSFSISTSVSVTLQYATLPYTESFEDNWIDACGNHDAPNNFWRTTPVTGNNSWRRNDDGATASWTTATGGAYTPTASDGSYSARYHSYYTSTKGTFDFYVNCNTPTQGKRLSFDFINTSGKDSLVVYLSKDGGATFARLDSVLTSAAWRTKTIVFASNSATTVIRFEATGDYNYTSDIGLDNVSVTSLPDCSGTLLGGTTISSLSSACPGVPFLLSINGGTDLYSAYGLTSQWQYSTDGGTTWNNVSGATDNTLSVNGIFTTTLFRRNIRCGASSVLSTPVTITVTNGPAYASLPFTESFEATWLSVCDVNNAPNNYWRGTPFTGNNSWRRNDDGASGKWTSPASGAYSPSATDGSFSARFHSYYATRDSKGQLNLFINAATASATKRLNFDFINTTGGDSLTILLSTDGGISFTRLDSLKTSVEWRSKAITFTASSAQTVIRFEATSDYGGSDIGLDNITIVNYPACSGAPVAGTATTNSPVCAFAPFTVTVTGGTIASGLTFQWQQSTNGGVTWTNITGATAEKYLSGGIAVPTSFRRQVTCSGSTVVSTPVDVTLTPVAYATLPFTESFEAAWLSLCNVRETPNNYWRNSPLTGDASWRRNDDGAGTWSNTGGAYTPAASVGIYSARFHSYQALSGKRGGLYLHVNANSAAPMKRLRFDYINTSGNDSLVVSLSTDGGLTFTRLDSVKTTAVWKSKTIVFTSTSATTVLRFEGISDNGSTDIGLDNIIVIDFPTCNGAPIGGTITSSSTNVCPSTPFTMNVTGATDAYGITYQWQQSTNGGTTWTNITGATAEAYTSAGITVNTSFRRQITCSGTDSYSTAVDVTINVPTYVTLPYSESFENTWISGCGLRDIPNNSWRNSPVIGNNSWRRVDDGDAAGWTGPTSGDYNPDASDGTYSARFHSYYASSGTKGQFNLYINANTASSIKRLSFDYINVNGLDTLAVYLSTDGGATFTYLDGVKIATAWTSKSIQFNSLSATTVIRFEATSDYGTTDFGLDNVLITDFAPCTGLPAGGTAQSNKSVVCGEPFTLTLTGSSSAAGIMYQWQSSTDNVNYTDIPGATNFTYTTTQVGTTWYRATVTCTNTNEIALSGAVEVVSPALVSGTYKIDNAVPTNTADSTFNSFNDAYNFIKCGINGPITFKVIDNSATVGVYNEQLVMGPIPGASSVNTVTFKGNMSTIAYSSTNTNERAVIKLRGADFIRFDSLVINAGAGTYGYGVQLISNADSNIISNCIINTDISSTSTTNYGGIVINGSESGITSTGTVLCDYNIFDHNTITGGYLGISLVATQAGANGNNQFTNNTIKDFYRYGMYVSASYKTLIEGNSFSRPTRSVLDDFYGLYFTGVSTQTTISKNRISNPFGGDLASTKDFYGIYFTSVDAILDRENYVTNNVIYNINGEGAQTGIYNSSSDFVWYFHNTIALDSLSSASTSTTRGFYQTGTAGSIYLYDNMITISRAGEGTKHAIYFNTNTTGFFADNNDYYLNAGAGTNVLGYFNTNQPTLGDWQKETGQDAKSISRNPFYADVAAGDYRPTSGAVDNKGVYAGIDTDILNVARNTTTPDIGAFEFTALPCTLPPDAGFTRFSDTVNCQNSPVRIGLTLTSWGATQTFQWQTATSAAGPWTDFGGLREDPDTTIMSTVSLYYRVGVTCGGTTVYSNPLQMMVNPALPAGTYTINKNDPAGNTYIPGNPGGNFISFNDAKAAMGCGIYGGHVIFNVVAASGPYNEQLILDSIPGVTDTSTITFNGNGNTIKLTAYTSSERAVIKLRGTDHIIFDSLIIDGTASGTYGVQLVNNADSNTFRKCTILANTTSTANNYAGVVINASETSATLTGATLCDGNRFDRNTITGGYYGVTLMGGTTAATYISNNSFTNNTISEFYSYGFYIGGTYNTLIENNIFTRPARANTAASVYGIYATGAVSNRLAISKNRFMKFFGGVANSTADFYAVYHSSVDATTGNEVKVTNNLVYGIESDGAAYGFYNSGSNNVFYYHNTVSFDDATSATTERTVGLYQTTAATGIFFKNNIVTIRRGGTGTKYGVYMNQTTNTEVTASNNDYYVSGINAFVGYRTGNRLTLADWQTASGQDANSYSLNPLYTDTASGNFKPQLVAIDNKGIPVGVTTDIENVSRNTSTPDIGAYEFIPTPCSAPVAGNAIVTPNTGVCLEMPLHLTVQNHSTLGSITFQWQYSPDGVSNWTNIGPLQYFPDFDTLTTVNSYYRAAVTCDATTVYTDTVHVNLNPLLLAGTYTIDTTQATGGTNFHSFGDAVTAMLCGITGPVVFNVATGTYTEQITIPYIRNTSVVNTVTFQSASGNANDVKLLFGSASAAANYTLQLDGTKYFTFRNMSFVADSATYGRAVELTNNASFINFNNNVILVPTVTTGGTDAVGIYAYGFAGKNIVLKGNIINGGSRGIFLSATGTRSFVIDSNKVNSSYQYGIYTEYTKQLSMRGNTVTLDLATADNAAGIYAAYADTAFRFTGNTVKINNNTAPTAYGIYIYNSHSGKTDSSIVANNRFVADSANAGTLYGLTIEGANAINVVNNVISINSAGSTAYGLYSVNNSDYINFYNNTVHVEAAAANGYAGYFNQPIAASINVNNNIFSNKGGGKALYVSNPSFFKADYNLLYTTGSTLVEVNTGGVTAFANLKEWTKTWNWDRYSISYQPAFVSATDLRPDVTKPDVWAMHGRGTQIPGNSYDFNNQKRPETLTAGVPDLGAYEFYPTALPTVLTATPSVPAANSTQTFSYGTDTVMKITWGATAPPSIEVRRFSGVVPTGLLPTQDSMFFYTKVDIPGGADYSYAAKLYYINPWQGSIPQQYMIGLGRTTPSNAWVVGQNSKVDVGKKEISQDAIIYLDRFTGLVNPYAKPDGDDSTSNRGKDFWVGYQRTNGFGSTPTSTQYQDMVIYMGAGDQDAKVTITIEGTSGTPWVKQYDVKANTTVTSDAIPKLGANDARLFGEGKYLKQGIHITSDVPIAAYAHIYESTNSGATMLMPSTVWGYEYYTMQSRQYYSPVSSTYPSSSAFHIVAQHDSTWVEINPSAKTLNGWIPNGGTQPNGSYLVKLNKGDVYQVLGALKSGSEGWDLTGSYVKSVAGPTGCYPVAVFAGSTRTGIGCGTSPGSSGDLIIQQIFPYQAWGTKYLVAPTNNQRGPNDTTNMTVIYRVMVKDSTTDVKRNGSILPKTNLVNSRYYQFESSSPYGDYIESNKPVLVAQYMASEGNCTNTNGDGDPEMFYISPLEQAIKKTQFYRNNKNSIDENFITLIIPTEGLSTLRIDGVNYEAYPAADYVVLSHLYNGYSIVTKKWAAGAGSSSVESDYPFTGLVYGLGSYESYGYNIGTLVKNLNNLSNINTTYNTGTTPTGYTCSNAPFQITAYLPLIPDSLRFNITAISGLTPATNVTIKNPTPTATTEVNGVQYYTFTLPQSFTLGTAGTFTVPIDYWSPEIESCDKKKTGGVIIQVLPKPKTDFQVTYANALAAACEGETVNLKGDLITGNGIALSQWQWNFAAGGSQTTANGQNQTISYPTAGTYAVKLTGITADGCISDTTKNIVFNAKPLVTLAQDNVEVCPGTNASFQVSNPISGAVYNWYSAATGGTLLGTGITFTLNNVTPPASVWVEATSNGCTSVTRKEAKATLLGPLTPTNVRVLSKDVNSVTFTWDPVALANPASYQVSVAGGPFIAANGLPNLTHTVSGLRPTDTVSIRVRAIGNQSCQTSTSLAVTGQTLPDEIFIPNSFSPNGDGKNDQLLVYGYVIKEMTFMVFNQWGEKIFESKTQNQGWDGTYKGKAQPSGVYIYVSKFILKDGSTIERRGTINLLR